MNIILDSWTDVANRALSSLGRERLTAVTEDTPDAQSVRDFLPEAIRICSEFYDWSFLRKIANLYPVQIEGSTYLYSLPPNFWVRNTVSRFFFFKEPQYYNAQLNQLFAATTSGNDEHYRLTIAYFHNSQLIW